MSGYLVDTNVVSEAVKRSPDPNVGLWFKSIQEDLLFLSVLTLGEIRRGIVMQSSASRRSELEAWLDNDVVRFFQGRILDVDSEVAKRWGLVTASMRARGTPLPVGDALLAATALHYSLILVTRNTRDVVATGVPVLNPWQS
jgi:predicted nucleic acid-binding protein